MELSSTSSYPFEKMKKETISIFLVDDHRIFVKGLASLLGTEDEVQVLGYTFDGPSVLKQLEQGLPDLLITDIQMPGMSGIELTRIVKEEYPGLKVIGLSMFDKPEII